MKKPLNKPKRASINARIPPRLREEIDNYVKTIKETRTDKYTHSDFIIEACELKLEAERNENKELAKIYEEYINRRIKDPRFQQLFFSAFRQNFSITESHFDSVINSMVTNPEAVENLFKMFKAYKNSKK